MRNRKYKNIFLFIFISFFTTNICYAEGSRDLNKSLSNEAFRVCLSYAKPVTGSTTSVGWYRVTTLDSLEARNSFFVYAKEGEKIALASSALGLGTTGAIKLYDINGTLLFHWTAPGALLEGKMPTGAGSKRIENQGPNGLDSGGIGGYKPLLYTVPLGQSGVYRVEFISPVETNGSTSSYAVSGLVARAKEDFIQQTTNVLIAAFDVSIISAGGALIKGRLFADYMSLTGGELRRNSGPLRYYFTEDYTLYILTYEGYKYETSFKGLAPYGYFIYADNVGMQLNDGITPAYESTAYAPVLPSNRRIFKNTDPDNDYEHHHKMFFNNPDVSMPAVAINGGVSSWLNPIFVLPTYSYDLTLLVEQAPNPLSGWFRFDFPNNGIRFRILIDVNDNNNFGDGNDVILTGATISGLNYIWWNGFDGAGVPVPNTVCVKTKIEFLTGEMHIPLADAEMLRYGVQIKRTNGYGTLPNYNINWNDLPLADNSNIYPGYVKKTPTYGTSSFSYAHRWEANESGVAYYFDSTHKTLYGDNRYMDNWAFDTSNSKIYPALVCSSILDVKFEQFNIKNNELNWTINNKTNGNFNIEFSEDGIHFITIKSIMTDINKQTYNYIHYNLKKGFYRINLISPSQKLYSKILKTKEDFITITAYPNPTKDFLQFNIKDNITCNLLITSVEGKKVLENNFNSNQKVDIKFLPAGFYVANITVKEQKIKHIKFQIIK
jgi:Secretion system C-terminal sorting domain